MKNPVSELQKQLDASLNKSAELNCKSKEMKDMFTEIIKKFDEQGKKFDEQGEKFDEQGKKFDEQGAKVEKMYGWLSTGEGVQRLGLVDEFEHIKTDHGKRLIDLEVSNSEIKGQIKLVYRFSYTIWSIFAALIIAFLIKRLIG